MTADIYVFTPKSNADATQNMAAFVAMCRSQLTVFGKDLQFEDIAWDVTEALQLKGHGRKRVRIFFSTQETVDDNIPSPMAEPFVSFAKSYVRYMQGMRPTKSIAFRVAALRSLEVSLRRQGYSDPVRVDGETFNWAARVIAERLSKATAYRVSSQLEMLAEFMSQHRLTVVPLTWRNFMRRPIDTVRVGQEFDKRRVDKMPSVAALEALPKAFHLATQTKDVLYSSIAAILCSAPDRINELLLLAEACEIHEKTSEGKNAYGLRWWPAKGSEPMVKWIIPAMAPVVSEAIAKIRRLTEESRRIARWYESNPGKLYLPPELEQLRTKNLLTMDELCHLLFVNTDDRYVARHWCALKSVPIVKRDGLMKVHFRDVECAVVSALPTGFPFLNAESRLKYSEALIIVRHNELHPRKATYRCVIDAVTINQVNTGLGSRSTLGFESIFDRLGFTEPDGSPIRVTTHQFRHYLNTLAQAGGMSQLDIAKWSGRIDVRQNEAYDHVSADQMVAKIRQSIGNESQMFGPLASLPKNIPISRDEFARLKIPTAHTTDFGFCVHDYTMTPCEQHADCINCNEHVCVKGDVQKAAMVKRRLAEARELLARAEAATSEGYYGADRWMDHHQKTVARLTQLVEILDNPSIPSGSVIQLADVPGLSRGIEQALEERSALKDQAQPAILISNLRLISEG